MSYNGWANYETWNVALWLDNDEGLYNERIKAGQRFWDEAGDEDDRSQATRIAMADWIKETTEDMAPDLGASMFADLLSAALSEVDWHEIADNWLSEIDGYERAA